MTLPVLPLALAIFGWGDPSIKSFNCATPPTAAYTQSCKLELTKAPNHDMLLTITLANNSTLAVNLPKGAPKTTSIPNVDGSAHVVAVKLERYKSKSK